MGLPLGVSMPMPPGVPAPDLVAGTAFVEPALFQRLGEARRAVAGGNHERDTSLRQRGYDGKGVSAIQVDIEDCDVEGQRFGFLDRIAEARGDADDLAADLGEGIFSAASPPLLRLR